MAWSGSTGSSRTAAAAAVVAVAMLGAAAPASAISEVDAFVEITGGWGRDDGSDGGTLFDGTRNPKGPGGTEISAELADSSSVPGAGTFSAEGRAEASDLRQLKTYAFAQADTLPLVQGSPGTEARISVLSQLDVRDEITISAPQDLPGLDGQPGTTTLSFSVDGRLIPQIFGPPGAQWSGDVEAQWNLTGSRSGLDGSNAEILDLFPAFGQARLFTEGALTDARTVNGVPVPRGESFSVSVPFTYGETFLLELRFRSDADVRLDGGGDGIGMLAESDFENTVTLQPITAFTGTTAEGELLELSGLPVLSASGVDYAVPEPGTATLLFLGLLGMAGLTRRGRH